MSLLHTLKKGPHRMFPQNRSLAVLSLCLVGLTLLAPIRIQAAIGTWTNNGNGNWSTTTNWSGGTVASGSGFTANFSTINISADRSVTVDGARTIGNLIFGDTGTTYYSWYLSGSALTLAGGTPTITVNNGNAQILSDLAGTVGFTKEGSNALILRGDNSGLSGTVTLNSASTLALGAATAGSVNAAFNLAVSGGTLNTDSAGVGHTVHLGSLAGVAGTTLRSGGALAQTNTFSIGALGTSTVFAGNIIDSNASVITAITKVGAGTLTLSGTNTHTAGTTISVGTLQIGNGGTTGSIAGNITNNSALAFNRSDALAYGGNVSGSGSLTQLGGGTTTLSGTNSYLGNTIISAGTLLVNGSLSNSSAVQVGASGTLGGHGSVGAITGAGTVAPGNSPGILTALSVDGASGLDFYIELTALAPTYNNAANSLNDVLRLTAGTPFVTPLDGDNTVTVDFSTLSLAIGQTYYGGFYADAGDFASSISGANFVFAGAVGFTIAVSTVQQTANFGSGNVGGWVTQFDVLAIPEPSTALLLTAGLMVTLFLRRRSPRSH